MDDLKNMPLIPETISQLPAPVLQNLGCTYLSRRRPALRGGEKLGSVAGRCAGSAVAQDQPPASVQGVEYDFLPATYGTPSIPWDVPLQDHRRQRVGQPVSPRRKPEETIEGDKKSYTLQCIDWKPGEQHLSRRRRFSIAAHAAAMSTTEATSCCSSSGIPLVVIRCETAGHQRPISQAISQHLRSQQEGGIRLLCLFADPAEPGCQRYVPIQPERRRILVEVEGAV